VLYGILIFIVNTVAGVFAGFLLLRFWMQVQRVRPPMGLAQSIFQLTDWLVHPIRRLVPGFAGFDWASLLAAFLVALVSAVVEFWLVYQLPLSSVVMFGVLRLAQWILYGLMALLVIEVIFSWVNPHAPFAPFIRALNEPLLAPLRKVIPPMGGLDFSPMVVMMIIIIVSQVVDGYLHPLHAY
jgi:YggT family protein